MTAEKIGIWGVMRLYMAADGYHYDCKMCDHVAKPFDTREQRKAAVLAHLRQCWPTNKERVNAAATAE